MPASCSSPHLAHRSLTYAEATFTQTLPDWIGSHTRAFGFYGGVPAMVVSDNLKSGITKACFYEPGVNRADAEMAEHYDTAIVPAYADLKNICVWAKNNGGMGSLYRFHHEFVFVFKSGTAPHINNIELGKHGRHRTNVWNYAGGEDGSDLNLHPTVKRVAMVADAIRDCSHRKGIVLDAFLGSGTTSHRRSKDWTQGLRHRD